MTSYLMLLFLVTQQDCREAYLNKVLESENYAHYFIVVKVRTEKNVREIVVLNYNLYILLKSHNDRFGDIKYYKDFMKDKIIKNEAVEVTEKDLVRMEASSVTKDKNVEIIAAKGDKYFLNKYFNVFDKGNYASLKYNVNSKENTIIIKKLFEWNYLIGLVESNITVLDKNFCDNYSDSSSKH